MAILAKPICHGNRSARFNYKVNLLYCQHMAEKDSSKSRSPFRLISNETQVDEMTGHDLVPTSPGIAALAADEWVEPLTGRTSPWLGHVRAEVSQEREDEEDFIAVQVAVGAIHALHRYAVEPELYDVDHLNFAQIAFPVKDGSDESIALVQGIAGQFSANLSKSFQVGRVETALTFYAPDPRSVIQAVRPE